MLAHAFRCLSDPTPDLPLPRVPPEVEPVERLADVVLLPTAGVIPTQRIPSSRETRRYCIELNLLGGFRLLAQGQPVPVGLSGQRLLAVLACRGRQVPRSQIAHALWPDNTDARSHANLRSVLYRLQRTYPNLVLPTKRHLQLHAGVLVDFERATQLATRLLSREADRETTLLEDAQQTNLFDDLLPDWDDEWLGDHQYNYRQLRLDSLETLSGLLAACDRHGAAVQMALAAVQADSLRESAHETLIRAWLAHGNRNEAITHYMTYRRILQDELGLDPPVTLDQLLWSA
jgi:DNA-binding SARP family transcriptional activator